MNNQFDELTKSLAQSVTRREALKKFGFGLAGMALACFGLANKAEAGKTKTNCVKYGEPCNTDADCCSGFCNGYSRTCGCTTNSDCGRRKSGLYCDSGTCFGVWA